MNNCRQQSLTAFICHIKYIRSVKYYEVNTIISPILQVNTQTWNLSYLPEFFGLRHGEASP